MACRSALAQPAEGARYVGIETSVVTGHSRASFFSESGQRLRSTALDFRAHGMAQHDTTLIVFPRRPGDKMAVLDVATLDIKSVLTAPAFRRFCGHGAFSSDGRYLLVTENDLNTLQGFVGIYDAQDRMARLGSVALPGPGPHEIIRVPDLDRFVIAVGGLETHPDYGRTPLNLFSFRSQLVALDLETGAVEDWGFWPGTEGVSLRHLAYDAKGRLYIGAQVADTRRASAENVLCIVEDGQVTHLPEGALLGGYVSSVAAHGAKAMVTSKVSHAALMFDGARVLEHRRWSGASAVAVNARSHAVSGYDKLSVAGRVHPVMPEHEFDNHGVFLI